MKKTRISFCLLLLFFGDLTLAVAPKDTWTSAACAALLLGYGPEFASQHHPIYEIELFRRTMRAFAPDIREGKPIHWAIEGQDKDGNTISKISLHMEFGQRPALQEFSNFSTSRPSDEQKLAMAQRAFGIEYDIHNSLTIQRNQKR